MNFNLRSKQGFLPPILALAATLSLSCVGIAADSGMVTTTVTAVAKKENAQPPALTKDDVQLYQGKERVQVADWQRGGPLFLAILIDDSLDPVVASQWNDLRAFLMAQSQSTLIAVAYARNGSAMVAQDFTTDHALAAKALRIPFGDAGAFTSRTSQCKTGSNVGRIPISANPSCCFRRESIISEAALIPSIRT